MASRAQRAASIGRGVPDQSSADRSRQLRRRAAVDLIEGLRRWPLWATVGWLDVRQRYRRSLIGPFWITLSVAIFVTGLGLVFGALFQQDLQIYLPFLATGFMVWFLISSLLLEGCNVFISSEGAIKQVPVPISAHVYRMVWRNFIIFAHHIIIYLVILFLFEVDLGWPMLLAPLGLSLIAVNGVGFGLTFGILGARFRDIPLMMTNLVQLLFFMTPVIWPADSLPPERAWVAYANPIYYLVETVRQPLLGNIPSAMHWTIAGCFTVGNAALAVILYLRYRARIAYWL